MSVIGILATIASLTLIVLGLPAQIVTNTGARVVMGLRHPLSIPHVSLIHFGVCMAGLSPTGFWLFRRLQGACSLLSC